jgi:hypothetical protein
MWVENQRTRTQTWVFGFLCGLENTTFPLWTSSPSLLHLVVILVALAVSWNLWVSERDSVQIYFTVKRREISCKNLQSNFLNGVLKIRNLYFFSSLLIGPDWSHLGPDWNCRISDLLPALLIRIWILTTSPDNVFAPRCPRDFMWNWHLGKGLLCVLHSRWARYKAESTTGQQKSLSGAKGRSEVCG